MNSRSTMLWLTSALLFSPVLGCGGDGSGPDGRFESFPPAAFDPDDPEQVEMVSALSAPRAHSMGYIAVLLAAFGSGEICTTPSDGGEPVCMPTGNGCPAVMATADGLVIDGAGCTTDEGQTWTGRAVLSGFERDADGELVAVSSMAAISYEGLTIEGPSECPTESGTTRIVIDGTMLMTAGEGTLDFDLDLEITGSGLTDDCTSIASVAGVYDYQGTRREEGTREIWNGSGRFGTLETGVYEARTDEEVIDQEVCAHEAASGSTTVTAGSDVAVFTYDGAIDCDEASTVTWTYNGADRGELEGVQCAVGAAPSGAPGAATLLMGGLLATAFLRRRRRRLARFAEGR